MRLEFDRVKRILGYIADPVSLTILAGTASFPPRYANTQLYKIMDDRSLAVAPFPVA